MDSMDDMGHAPLHFAIENGCLSAIEQLIEYGADVNARDASDRTPLYLTIMYRDTLDVPSNACPKLKRVSLSISVYCTCWSRGPVCKHTR